jgi:hypothetical protein
MQEQIRIFAPWRDEFRSSFRLHGKKNPVETRADQTSFQSAASVDRFQSACKLLYNSDAWRLRT